MNRFRLAAACGAALLACGSRTGLRDVTLDGAVSVQDSGVVYEPGACEWILVHPPVAMTLPPENHYLGQLAVAPGEALLAGYAQPVSTTLPYDFFVRPASLDGTPVASPSSLFSNDEPVDETFGISSAVAFGEGRGAAVAFRGGVGCSFVPLDASGAIAGPTVSIAIDVGGSCEELRAIPGGFEFLDASALTGTVTIVSVDANGAPLARLPLAWAPQHEGAPIQYDDEPDGSRWLTWQDSADDGATCAAIQKFAPDGTAVTGRIQLGPCVLTEAYALPAMTGTSAGRLAVWRDATGFSSDDAEAKAYLYEALLDASGNIIAGPTRVSNRLVGSRTPSLVASGDDVLVLWNEGGHFTGPVSHAVLAVLSPAGALREAPKDVYSDHYLNRSWGVATPSGVLFAIETMPTENVVQIESIALRCAL